MSYQLCSYCSVSLTFFCIMIGIFRWLRIILVCNFKCILGYFVKLLFLTIFVFCLFSVCRTFKFDRNSHSCQIRFIWSSFYRADFSQAFPKISSRSIKYCRVTVFSLSAIYLNGKSAYLVELKLLLLFSLHPMLPVVPIFL